MSRLAFLEERPDGEPAGTLLCVHGFPESAWMWRPVLRAAAAAGWRAIAPDLPGAGDSPVEPPRTWDSQIAALDEFVAEQDLGPVVLCVHDWGGLIGLRWACDRGPEAVRALVIADTGFFADGEWHGIATVLRTPGEGEAFVEQFATPEAFNGTLKAVSTGMTDEDLTEYFKSFTTPEGRQGVLDLYRSGDFEVLAPYEGKLAALGVPALILWGSEDPFSPIAGAHRLAQEIADSELRILEGVGHFIYDDAPEVTSSAVVEFLARLA